MMAIIQSDMRCAFLHAATSTFRYRLTPPRLPVPLKAFGFNPPVKPLKYSLRLVRAFSDDAATEERVYTDSKPSICTADELHYVSVDNSDWRLALWRYSPRPQAPVRNHPLLLLSGVGTNAIGYDLSPESSFARYMAGQGFDTWILELRGAGLSNEGSDSKQTEEAANAISDHMMAVANDTTNGSFPTKEQSTTDLDSWVGSPMSANEGDIGISPIWDESKLVTELTETFIRLSERLSGFLSEGQSKIMSAKLFDQMSKLLEDSQLSGRFNEIREKLSGLLEMRQNSIISSQIRDLSERLIILIEESQRSVSPQLVDLQERLFSTIEDFQKQLDFIVNFDWDFDHYLEEDVPAAIDYIMAQTRPQDGKLLAIGHSMGGILLYALLSRCGKKIQPTNNVFLRDANLHSFEGRESSLAGVVTLAASLDYGSSKSALKLLLPLADPAQALNVPVIPLGALMSAVYPLTSCPPYVLAWLNDMISAQDMMHPELLKKLILNNFCTIPAKLLLQLTTAFRKGGLRDRNGKFFYKDHLKKSNVHVLAIAGDQDLICPPDAVYETVKLIPEDLVAYKVFGEPRGPHYAHYDLVGGRSAVEHVYPCVIEFLTHHDSI